MADLQSTNRVAIGIARESTFGTTPANPVFKALRTTSSALAAAPQTVTSNEIRGDRQVSDLILVGYQAGGDINQELSFRASDDAIEEALQGTWSNNPVIVNATADTEISDVSTTALTVASGGAAFVAGMLALMSGFGTAANNKVARVASSTGTSITFPASTFTAESVVPLGATARVIGFAGASGDIVATTTGGNALTSTSLDFTTLGISVGEWVRIGGASAGSQFATAASNGWARVSAVAANRLSFSVVPPGFAADSGTGKTIEVYTGDFLINGSTKRSNTIERLYLDHATSYEYITGLTLDALVLDLRAKAVATLQLTYIGDQGSIAGSRLSGATDIAASTNDVMNTSANIGRIGIGGSAVSGPNYLMSARVEFRNNLRRQEAIGELGAVGIGNGEFTVTGTLDSYFGDRTELTKLYNNTETSLDIRIGGTDTNGETLLFDFPRVKYSSGSPSVSGKNADVMLNLGFQALKDNTLGYTAACGRFWYLP